LKVMLPRRLPPGMTHFDPQRSGAATPPLLWCLPATEILFSYCSGLIEVSKGHMILDKSLRPQLDRVRVQLGGDRFAVESVGGLIVSPVFFEDR
jgi:hypothetical protein